MRGNICNQSKVKMNNNQSKAKMNNCTNSVKIYTNYKRDLQPALMVIELLTRFSDIFQYYTL